MSIAITVKYYPCTNHCPSRLRVSAHGKKTRFYSYDAFIETKSSEVHRAAVQRFLADYFPDWPKDWIEGDLDDNTTVHVINPIS